MEINITEEDNWFGFECKNQRATVPKQLLDGDLLSSVLHSFEEGY